MGLKLANMDTVRSEFQRQKQELIKSGKIKEKEDEGVQYIKDAFKALDECVERTKRESIAYAKWRDAKNREILEKSEYMEEDELISDLLANNARDYMDIYAILDGEESMLNKPSIDSINAHAVGDMILNNKKKQANQKVQPKQISNNTNTNIVNTTVQSNINRPKRVIIFDDEDE